MSTTHYPHKAYCDSTLCPNGAVAMILARLQRKLEVRSCSHHLNDNIQLVRKWTGGSVIVMLLPLFTSAHAVRRLE
jgi:hypothetical protein